jgi:hypothetical protein
MAKFRPIWSHCGPCTLKHYGFVISCNWVFLLSVTFFVTFLTDCVSNSLMAKPQSKLSSRQTLKLFNRVMTDKKFSSILIYFLKSKFIYTEKVALIKIQWFIKEEPFLIR